MSTRGRVARPRSGSRALPRRGLFWIDTNIDETTSSGTQDVTDLTTLMVDDEKKGATLVRLIISLRTVLTAAGSGGLVAMGLIVIKDDALSALALPEANSAGDQPGWLWRRQLGIACTDPNDPTQWLHTDLDLRAKRKFVGEDSNLCLVINAGTLTATINTDGWSRALFMRA